MCVVFNFKIIVYVTFFFGFAQFYFKGVNYWSQH
jgi:hypothetical protein